LGLHAITEKADSIHHVTNVDETGASCARGAARKLNNGGNGRRSWQPQMAPRTTDSTVDRLIDWTATFTTQSTTQRKKIKSFQD